MIGIIEFKKDTHERNRELVHKAKEAICELYESFNKDAMEQRIPREEFDDRRGGSNMRMGVTDYRGGYGHRGGQSGYRGEQMGYRHDPYYAYPQPYPFPFPGMDRQGQFEGRFTE